MSSIPPTEEEPGWPPRAAPELGFVQAEVRGLLPTRKSRARVAVGVGDLERAAPRSEAQLAESNLKAMHRILVLLLIVGGVSIVLAIISSVVVWGVASKADAAWNMVSEHITASQVSATIGNILGSVEDVKATTGNAASMSESVEQATETIVTALNHTGQLVSQFNEIAEKLVEHPQIQFGLGGRR